MERARQVSLFTALIFWATLIGGVTYSHIVYFPPYLAHLPESNNLIDAPYGIHDGYFWMIVHPLTILSLIVTVILNWKTASRKFILMTIGIYALAIIATAIYFVPELMAFASSKSSQISASEWFNRGQKWQHLSWTRGSFMYLGFIALLIALTKNNKLD